MGSSGSVRRREYSRSSGSASRKDDWASANRVPRGVTISLFGRPDDRNYPHPLSLIRHRDHFLPMSAPFDVASHAEERSADLAHGLIAIPEDWVRTPTARSGAWACLGSAGVDPGRRHGPGSE